MPPDHSENGQWFASEVQIHHGALRAWLRGRFPAVVDVENIIHEAFARVWRARNHGEVKSPKAFLFATAQNLAIDQARRYRVAQIDPVAEMSGLNVYEERPTPAEAAARSQELDLLTQAIQSLPDRCRQVLTLRKIYGLSQKEIARELGISEHTVEAQVANGMRRCAAFFRERGVA
ncbi:sigma-70 family RNA polymerase sigma factor [Opitutus sp. ER46]|uniref:RNA polymerase sigma factor n=1 Tax=Opitutus sp. ER46 TaxID=2161864 RepID=UPI00130480F2|nr:sigma-70 family RNA polymerase sigma factor [Opitutus sp. ER46]